MPTDFADCRSEDCGWDFAKEGRKVGELARPACRRSEVSLRVCCLARGSQRAPSRAPVPGSGTTRPVGQG
eukprot:5049934-Alexandrium_andersonii.AAC.1